MQLRYSPTSPFVRKVTITAIELGLDDKIERVATDPWSAETDLRNSNPLSKIPCLSTDDGMVLYDSPVICEYLDSLHNGPKLYPAEGKARFETLKLAATADGMIDAGVLLLVETMRRPEELRWDWWTERQTTTLLKGMDVLDAVADDMATEGPITIAEVTTGAGLGWIDLRFPTLGWRNDRPALADWFEKISDRSSFQATQPPAS